MRRLLHIFTVMFVVISSVPAMAARVSSQYDAVQQVATPGTVAQGIEVRTLVEVEIESGLVAGQTIVLSRVSLGAGAEYDLEPSSSPILLFATEHDVQIRDSFGFSTTLAGDSGIALPPDTAFTILAGTNVTSEILILDVQDLESGAVNPEVNVATPVTLFADARVEVLATQTVADPVDANRIFLSEAVIGADVDPARFDHVGAVTVYVQSGTVTSVSPSGLTGQIANGASFTVAPGGDLLIGSADGAEAYLFGLTGSDGSPISEITPTAVPPTPTPVPPTPTPVPPTPTVVPPTPTPAPLTETGTVLQLDETWRAPNADVVLSMEGLGRSGTKSARTSRDQGSEPEESIAVSVAVSYTNTSEERQDFTLDDDQFRIVDDNGVAWTLVGDDSITGQRVIVDPGETVTLSATFVSENTAYSREMDLSPEQYIGNVQMYFVDIAGASRMTWGFTLDRGTVRTHVFKAELDPETVLNELGTPVPPTPTPLPPTPTPLPPTPTPLPPTPTPTPTPPTEAGTILQLGETWIGPTGNMRFEYTDVSRNSMSWGQAILHIRFTYTNTSDSRQDYTLESATFQYEDDNGTEWGFSAASFFTSTSVVGQRIILDPGESLSLEFGFTPEGSYDTHIDTYSANVKVWINGLGGVDSAGWGFTLDRGKVREHTFTQLSPDTTSEDLSTAVQSSTSTDAPTNTDIYSLLPGPSEVPSHVVFALEQDRDLATISGYYRDPGATRALFEGWGWQKNVTRSYNMGNTGYPPAGEIEGIYTSIHLFSSDENARSAAEFLFSDMATDYLTVEEITLDPIGDWSRSLYGTVSYGYQTTIVVQRGPMVFLIYASSRDGNPTVGTWNTANAIVQRAG